MSPSTLERPARPISLAAGNFFYRIFKFFASLRLAIVSLSTVMIVLITGTFMESYYGAAAAKITVYDTLWFGVILFVLMLNVLAAALDRLPWKKRHIGFVTTHTGIIMILLGSFVTRQTVVDGQMAIAEGDTEYRITLAEPLVYIFSENEEHDWILPVKKKAFPWEGKQALSPDKRSSAPLPFAVDLISYYPKARVHEEIKAASQGPGMIKLHIKNSFMEQTLQLIEKDPERGSINMGPAVFSFQGEPLKEVQTTSDDVSYIEVKLKGNTFQMPLEKGMSLPAVFPLEGTPYELIINQVYQKAMVVGAELVDQTDENVSANPAAQLTLTGPDFNEDHTVFAKFPDFPTVHGMQPSAIGASVLYRLPGGGSKGETHELRFVKSDDKLTYQIQDGLKITSGEVTVGESVATGWMDLSFTVEEYLSHAAAEHHYTPMANTTQFEGATSALQIRLADASSAGASAFQDVWLEEGVVGKAHVGGRHYHLLYGQRRIPAGFKIQLKDFKVEMYPGTENPASYESDVVLKDDVRGLVKEVTISMNEPLKHRGYKVYQSGYSLEGEREVSIFSVGKNPGIPFQYTGTILMVLGIMTMFYTIKFSRAGGKL